MCRFLTTALLLTVPSLAWTMVMDNLHVAYQWKKLNITFPSRDAQLQAQQSRTYIPENNVPIGVEVYQDRLFITIPRWKPGVAASLVYLNLTDAPTDSPPLYPYPNWDQHLKGPDDSLPQIVSASRIRADACGNLWVLDSGYSDIIEGTSLTKPKLLIYSLETDQLLRSYVLPDDQFHQNDNYFANIAVEDHDCENIFAYLADVGTPGLVVYSHKMGRSWQVRHHYFNIDPIAGDMQVGGVVFQWKDGVIGLALSAPDIDGYSTLYFHPLTGFDEFSVSTKVLRDENLARNNTANFHQFKRLGSRGAKGQSGASFLDQESKVLFFASIHLNAVICWRTNNPNYTKESHSRVFMNNQTMVIPNDIKVDANHTLWVLSSNLPRFMYGDLDYLEYNFRVWKGKVYEAIKYTACESKMVVNKTIVEKIKDHLGKNKEVQTASSGDSLRYSLLLVNILLVAILP
ncbi:hypothetical protein NQ317_013433, partial [Molorchus minor]